MLCYFAPAGFVLSLFRLTRANYFLVLYGLTAYYFANRMNRLIILMGPIASALSGVAIGKGNCWAVDQFIALVRFLVSGGKVAGPKEGGKVGGDAKESKDTKGNKSTPSKSSKSKKQAAVVSEDDSLADTFRVMRKQLGKPLESVYYSKPGVLGRAASPHGSCTPPSRTSRASGRIRTASPRRSHSRRSFSRVACRTARRSW